MAWAGLLAGLLIASGYGAKAAEHPWVASFWPKAAAEGVPEAIFRKAFADFTPDPDILRSSANQAEFVRPLWTYLANTVSTERVETGTALAIRYRTQLAKIEAVYGVERAILVAIWGMETSYGTDLGDTGNGKNIIRSLATIAAAGGSRVAFAEEQLIAALKIIERGDVTLAALTGSWAGAMGQPQFIPTTYQDYAVDFDGDGKRDIWKSALDSLASMANFLRARGWQAGGSWGHEVILPAGFDYRLADPEVVKATADWAALGVKRPKGAAFARPDEQAAILLPTGARGPAFMIFGNFRVIKRYNNSDAYALAVGSLSDRIKGLPAITGPWPRDELPLSSSERSELQQLLAARGLYSGPIDGKLGRLSDAGLRTFQASIGMAPDGYPSAPLLQKLRSASR
ncbi:MAG: lytic murein transglycosylase [Bauldia sp.]